MSSKHSIPSDSGNRPLRVKGNGGSRLGIFGGCFDPIHNGHMHAVQTCVSELGLDLVLLVPSTATHHKRCRASFVDRSEMCLRATENMFRVAVSSIEHDYPGIPYTYRVLRTLHESHPGSDLFFIMGSDVYRTVPGWKGFETIVNLATLAVITRPDGNDRAGWRSRATLAEKDGRAVTVSVPGLQLSSSHIRERVSLGHSLNGLVHPGVAEYIRDTGLYAESGKNAGERAQAGLSA